MLCLIYAESLVHKAIRVHLSTPPRGGVAFESRGGSKTPPTLPTCHGLPEIIRALKSFSARRINQLRGTPGTLVWQRGYYEHIIRNERQLNRLRNYIEANPLRWKTDAENPAVKR